MSIDDIEGIALLIALNAALWTLIVAGLLWWLT